MGISNTSKNTLRFDNPSWMRGPDFFEIWEDWTDEYAAGPVTGTSPWIVTLLASGTSTMSTDAQGGKIILAGTTTDNSGAQVQMDYAAFNFATGTNIRCVWDATVSVTHDTEIFGGLAVTDTTLLDGTGTLGGGLTFSNGVGFYHPDDGSTGPSYIYGVLQLGSVTSATGPILIDLTTNHVFAFEVQMDPTTAQTGIVTFYIDGVYAGELRSTAFTAATTFLTPSLSITTGTNVGHTFTNDYIGARQWRS